MPERKNVLLDGVDASQTERFHGTVSVVLRH